MLILSRLQRAFATNTANQSRHRPCPSPPSYHSFAARPNTLVFFFLFLSFPMGNNPSSEKPRRAPQKLSKPRVGNHASNPVKDNLDRLNATRSNVSVHGQHPNTYNVGTSPTLNHEVAETPQIAVNGVSGELGNVEVPDTGDQEPLPRGARRLSGLIRSVSSKSQPEGVTRSESTGSATGRFNGVIRPKSMVQAATKTPSPTVQWVTLAQNYVSSPSNSISRSRPVSSEGIAQQDPKTTELHDKSANLEVEAPTDLHQARSPAVSPEPTAGAHVRSERAPYLARRSSFGQTPGAATRLTPAESQFQTRASFRKSLPLAPASTSHATPRAKISRRQSMPVTPMATEERIRAATPSDGDYRQLGGMPFGSLRITNGTSAPAHEYVPVREDTHHWPITSDHVHSEQSEALDTLASTMDDTAKLVVNAPAYEDPAVQLSAPESNTSSRPTISGPATTNAESEDTPRDEGSEVRASSSDGSNSSEDRSSDEHDQGRQLSVPSTTLDSGYASNNSIASDSDSKSAGKTSGESQELDGSRQPLDDQDKSSAFPSVDGPGLSRERIEISRDEEQAADVQRQHSLRARGSAMLSSFLSRKSRDSRSMDLSTPRSRASSTHSRGASLPDAPTTDEDHIDAGSSPRKGDDRGSQPSKLKRLLKSKRRSLPHDATFIVQDTTPMPSDAKHKLREHGFQVIPASAEKPPLRMEQSRDTLKTIISVGSGEDEAEAEAEDTSSSTKNKSRTQDRQRTDDQQSMPRPSNIDRTRSLLSPKPSSRQSRAALRKSMPVLVKPVPSNVEPVDEDLAETVQIWGYEAHMASIANIRHMAGNSAFDQAFVPMSRDNGAYHTPANMPPPPPPPQERPMHKSRSGWMHPPLRTRFSAPDFLETVCEPASPGGIDSTQQKPPKTPPPVSLRTRGSKKSRRRARSQHHSYRPHPHYVPPVPYLDMQESAAEGDNDLSSPRRLSQSLRSFPVQPPQAPPQGQHHAHSGHNPMHDQMHFSKPRYHGHHGSWNGPHAGQVRTQGPRMHHGYNSPAHRGPPIQSS